MPGAGAGADTAAHRTGAAAQAMKAGAIAAAALLVVALGVGKSAAADPAAAGVSLQPGQWETTARVEGFEMPGAPARTQAQARAQMRREESSRACITPEQAADPLQPLRRLSGSMSGQTCRISDDVFTGGAIRLAMTCQGPDEGPTTRLSMIGRYDATSMTARMSVGIETPPTGPSVARQTIRIVANVAGRRLGDCSPEPPAPAPIPSPAPEN